MSCSASTCQPPSCFICILLSQHEEELLPPPCESWLRIEKPSASRFLSETPILVMQQLMSFAVFLLSAHESEIKGAFCPLKSTKLSFYPQTVLRGRLASDRWRKRPHTGGLSLAPGAHSSRRRAAFVRSSSCGSCFRQQVDQQPVSLDSAVNWSTFVYDPQLWLWRSDLHNIHDQNPFSPLLWQLL